LVSTDDNRKTLVMQRDEARTLVNFGDQPYSFDLLEGEKLWLVSRSEVAVEGNAIELPGMTLAVLMSTTEQMEDRQVH
jgi:maltooligosyltrehalose trehalohydrolase